MLTINSRGRCREREEKLASVCFLEGVVVKTAIQHQVSLARESSLCPDQVL